MTRAARRLVTLSILVGGLAACGAQAIGSSAAADGASKSATIRAWTTAQKLIPEGADTAVTARRIVIQVRPHCVDGSSTLDCEGRYTFAAAYRVAPGKSERPACIDQSDSALQFAGGDVNPVTCATTPDGRLTLSATAQVGTTPNPAAGATTPPPVSFQVTVDRTGTQRYAWRSRDGAHCKAKIPRRGPATRTECTWS